MACGTWGTLHEQHHGQNAWHCSALAPVLPTSDVVNSPEAFACVQNPLVLPSAMDQESFQAAGFNLCCLCSIHSTQWNSDPPVTQQAWAMQCKRAQSHWPTVTVLSSAVGAARWCHREVRPPKFTVLGVIECEA